MLKSKRLGGCLLVACMAAAVSARAERLEPVLRAGDLTGTVTVRRAGDDSFKPVEEGRTYPYGSRFRTAAESGVLLAMSEASSVRIMANAEILFTESSRDASAKTVQVVSGEVEASLSRNFREGGNTLHVVAADVVTQAIGTRYRVASRMDKDLQIVIIRALSGIVRVMSENFEIAELKTDQWVSLLSPPDKSFMRLRNEQGEFDVQITNHDKSIRQLSTEEGSVLKIWQRIVPETGERIVHAVFTDPEGMEVANVSVTFAPGEYAGFLADVRDADDEFPWERLEDDPERTRRRRRERREPRDRDNPMPPDDVMHEYVQRTLEDLAPGAGKRPASTPTQPPPPRPRPSPTPVGRR